MMAYPGVLSKEERVKSLNACTSVIPLLSSHCYFFLIECNQGDMM